MAQEHSATMMYVVLGYASALFPSSVSKRQFEGRLEVQAHCHRPGRTYRSIALLHGE
jgi:hypothetical protein